MAIHEKYYLGMIISFYENRVIEYTANILHNIKVGIL